MFGRDSRLRSYVSQAEELAKRLAEIEGILRAKTDALGVVADYEQVKQELADAEIRIAKIKEDHARERREIEHKIGLHKTQVESEIRTARKEAELAVREETMTSLKEQHEKEMQFREERFKDEQEATRSLLNQILNRLPSYSHQTVRHEGVQPQVVVGELPSGE